MAAVIEELTSLKAANKQQSEEYRAAKSEHDTMMKLAVNLQALLGKDVVKMYKQETVL